MVAGLKATTPEKMTLEHLLELARGLKGPIDVMVQADDGTLHPVVLIDTTRATAEMAETGHQPRIIIGVRQDPAKIAARRAARQLRQAQPAQAS